MLTGRRQAFFSIADEFLNNSASGLLEILLKLAKASISLGSKLFEHSSKKLRLSLFLEYDKWGEDIGLNKDCNKLLFSLFWRNPVFLTSTCTYFLSCSLTLLHGYPYFLFVWCCVVVWLAAKTFKRILVVCKIELVLEWSAIHKVTMYLYTR